MKYGLVILLVLMSLVIILPAYSAEDSCSYCGVWIPVEEKYGTPYSSGDRLTITEKSLALPGCQPVKSMQVFLTHGPDYIAPEGARLKPLKTILQTEGPMNCVKQLPGLSNSLIVEIELRPRGYENSEELTLVYFESNALDELKASYTFEMIPTPPGKKQMMKRRPRPKELGGWWFINGKYDPCSEGSGRGALNCALIEHKKVDEVLKTEWQRLLAVIAPDKKNALITTQQEWLKASASICAKEGAKDRGYHPWGLAYETSCLAKIKKDRVEQFQVLRECISVGGNCKQLEMKP